MSDINIARLDDRGLVRISGSDAATLLDGLVTNSLGRLADRPAIHTGLLSPQGKILFDFFVIQAGDDLYLDVAHESTQDLIKRLTFYRLRADVTFENMSDKLTVCAAWPAGGQWPGGVIAYADPRLGALGERLILPPERLAELAGNHIERAQYEAHRITLGVPDAGHDYELGDTFAHEALYDQLGSIDFKKGCFVGQEVASRMQHRGTARKRAIRIKSDAMLSPGQEISAGEAKIGVVGSAAAQRAIALLRLDRAAEARAQSTLLTVEGGDAIELDPPDWITFDISSGKPRENA